jgi:hypothetical protein
MKTIGLLVLVLVGCTSQPTDLVKSAEDAAQKAAKDQELVHLYRVRGEFWERQRKACTVELVDRATRIACFEIDKAYRDMNLEFWVYLEKNFSGTNDKLPEEVQAGLSSISDSRP